MITAATVIVIYMLRMAVKSSLLKSMTISERLQEIGDKIKSGFGDMFADKK